MGHHSKPVNYAFYRYFKSDLCEELLLTQVKEQADDQLPDEND